MTAKPSSCSFYYPQTLKEIAQDMPSDFIIRSNNGKEFGIRSFVAANFSQKIFMMMLEDATTDEMYVDMPASELEKVVMFLQAKSVPIAEDNCVFLFKAACEFMISSLADSTMGVIIKTQKIEEIAKLTRLGFESSIDVELMTNIVAQNIVSCFDIVKDYPEPLFDLVFQSPLLNLQPEQLLSFLTQKTDFTANHNSRLLKFLPSQVYKEPEFDKIIQSPDFNVNILRYVFLNNRSYKVPKKSQNKRSVFPVQLDALTKGIIQAGYLQNVSSSSVYSEAYSPFNVIVDDDTYYCSEDPKNYEASLTFDFTPNQISIDAYALRSWRIGANGVCPTTWTVSIMVKDQWIEIDKRENNTSLCENSKICAFELQDPSPATSQIMITQISSGNIENRRFALSFVEFFGKVINN